METIELKNFEIREIKNVSGKTIYLKSINIPNENCSNFELFYRINYFSKDVKKSGKIDFNIEKNQPNISIATLKNYAIDIPHNNTLYLYLVSKNRPNFLGKSIIVYSI